jgi:diacylglycerol kinase (ATP)
MSQENAAINADCSHVPRQIRKVGGLLHLFAALRNSIAGVRRLWGEVAFRQEVAAVALIFPVFAVLGASASQFVIMSVLLFGLAAAEALNTAIEEIIDRISPEWSSTGMHAKDLGSFAVFCMLAANAMTAMFVIGSRLLSP